jgi:hypothetical protein
VSLTHIDGSAFWMSHVTFMLDFDERALVRSFGRDSDVTIPGDLPGFAAVRSLDVIERT